MSERKPENVEQTETILEINEPTKPKTWIQRIIAWRKANHERSKKEQQKKGPCKWFYISMVLNLLIFFAKDDLDAAMTIIEGYDELLLEELQREFQNSTQEEFQSARRRLQGLGSLLGGLGGQAGGMASQMMGKQMDVANKDGASVASMMHGKQYKQADRIYLSLQAMHQNDAQAGRSGKYSSYMMVIVGTLVTCSHCCFNTVPPVYCYIMTASGYMRAMLYVLKEKIGKDSMGQLPSLIDFREQVGPDRAEADLWEIETALVAMKVALDQTEFVTGDRAEQWIARIGELFHYHPKAKPMMEFSKLYKEAGLAKMSPVEAQELSVICPEAEHEALERGDVPEIMPLPSKIDRITLEHPNVKDPLCFFSVKTGHDKKKRDALRSLVTTDQKGELGAYNSLFIDDQIDYCKKKLSINDGQGKAELLSKAGKAGEQERAQMLENAENADSVPTAWGASKQAFGVMAPMLKRHPLFGALMPVKEEPPHEKIEKLEMLKKFLPDLKKYGMYLMNKKARPELYNVRTGLADVIMRPLMIRMRHALEKNSEKCNVPFKRFKRLPNKASFAWYEPWTWCKCRWKTNDDLRKDKIAKYLGKMIHTLGVMKGDIEAEKGVKQTLAEGALGKDISSVGIF